MSDFKQLTAYTNVKCKYVASTLPSCDLLARCDWHEDELRVELPQWPEVVNVWVDGKAMPYAPVTTDLAEEIRSKVVAWSEVAKLREERDMYSDLVEMMDHPDINAQLKAENEKLRKLVKLDWEWAHSCCGSGCRLNTEHCGYAVDRECNFEREIYDRMRELGIEVDNERH